MFSGGKFLIMFIVVVVLFICVSEWFSCWRGKSCGLGKVEVNGMIDGL